MIRLDVHLVKLGLAPSRQRAKELILSEQIYLEEKPVSKPSLLVSVDSKPQIKGDLLPYPSRAGLKLEKALQVFQVNVENLVVLDVGASTGGFTSCLLQFGARKVYAVDVGHGQLAAELREDPRVINLEKTNVRDLTVEQLGEKVDLITIDVSFISLRLVFPAVRKLLKAKGAVIALVKPQFETDGVGLNKQGVIKDLAVHERYIPPLIEDLAVGGLKLTGFTTSPISGTKGNLEYLAYFCLGADNQRIEIVQKVIRDAWGRDC